MAAKKGANMLERGSQTDNTMHDLRAERFYKQSWRTGCGPRRPDQDIPAARDQGLAAVLA
jgi:hypothetical protein